MTRTPDIEGIEDFSISTDRELTEFFVGRESELDFIARRVGRVARRHSAGAEAPAEGCTILITGVPGAGKTSLMTLLRRKWKNPDGPGPIGVAVDLSDLSDSETLALAVRRSVSDGVGPALADYLRSFSIGALGVSAGVEFAGGEASFSDVGRPVALFIDEIQSIPGRPDAPEALLLQSLHLGTHGAPVVPVLAGLAHATDVLEEAGLSRLSDGSVLPLGALSREEACRSAELFLDAFDVAGDRTGWPEAVARWSDGWPMHVHNSLRALAGGLAACGGHLDRVDRAEVKMRAARSRTRYYGQRTAGILEEHPELLGRIMESIPPFGMRKAGILQLIRSRLGEAEGEFPAAGELFRSMLSKGLIQGGLDGRVVCPIPSMRSWCAAGGGSDLHQAAMEGDAGAVLTMLQQGTDPDARDVRGRTPLHIAAEENWPEVAKVLLAGGADRDAADLRGRRPLAPPGRAAKPSGCWPIRCLPDRETMPSDVGFREDRRKRIRHRSTGGSGKRTCVSSCSYNFHLFNEGAVLALVRTRRVT